MDQSEATAEDQAFTNDLLDGANAYRVSGFFLITIDSGVLSGLLL